MKWNDGRRSESAGRGEVKKEKVAVGGKMVMGNGGMATGKSWEG